MDELLKNLQGFWEGLAPALQICLILGGGLLLAFFARFLIILLLRLIRFEKLCDRLGFSEFLKKGGLSYTPNRLVSVIVFWILLFWLFLELSNRLELIAITNFFNKVLNSLPGLVAAVIVLVGGWVILGFFANVAVTVARNAGSGHARLIGQVIRYSGLLLVVILAVGQIEIGTGILSTMLLILFGALCFGFALALGLGCQDMVKETVQRIARNLREQRRHGKSGDLEG